MYHIYIGGFSSSAIPHTRPAMAVASTRSSLRRAQASEMRNDTNQPTIQCCGSNIPKGAQRPVSRVEGKMGGEKKVAPSENQRETEAWASLRKARRGF